MYLAIGIVIGLAVGWAFPQPQWVADAWASFKTKWLK